MGRVCCTCKNEQDPSQFTRAEYRCKSCNRLRAKQYRERNPEQHRERVRKSRNKSVKVTQFYYKKYSIRKYWPHLTIQQAWLEYTRLVDEQKGLCKLCNKPETKLNHMTNQVQPLSIDHCHSTGRVRGLLCNRCNRYIAHTEENFQIIGKIPEYLLRELSLAPSE